MMMDVIVWLVLIAFAIALLWMIINFKMSEGCGSAAGASAFADFQNQEKRNAMEMVIEQKAGNIKIEDETAGKDKL